MRIKFECDGGFAGLLLRWQGDTDSIGTEAAATLKELVERAGLLEAPTGVGSGMAPPAHAGPPDVFSYRLRIEAGDQIRDVAVTDVTAPARMRPLLAHLRNLAIAGELG